MIWVNQVGESGRSIINIGTCGWVAARQREPALMSRWRACSQVLVEDRAEEVCPPTAEPALVIDRG